MFHLIEPQLGRISGGLRYNHAVVDAAAGRIIRHELPGARPKPTQTDVSALHELISSLNAPVLLDGLIGCSLSSPVVADVPIVQLVHALADTPSAQHRERVCLRAADAVIATSQFAADRLTRRHNIDVTVAQPGVGPLPAATGSDGGHFICVGGIEPNKNQRFLTDVLTRVHEAGLTGWHCTFVGPITDAAYAQDLCEDFNRLPQTSTTLTGELDAAALAAVYDTADLLLMPSRAETFGLVVREALAAAIPALVTAGTGAEEALAAGRALELDETLWAHELQRWLTDADYRGQLRQGATVARQHLSFGWQATADVILGVLESVSSG